MSALTIVENCTLEQLQAFSQTSLSAALTSLGISHKDARARRALISRMEGLGIGRGARQSSQYTDSDIVAAVASALCMSDVMRSLGLSVVGGNHMTVKRAIARLQLSTQHFDVKATMRRGRAIRHTAETLLVPNCSAHRSTVRAFVLKHQLLPYQCKVCSNEGTWNNEALTLELDHTDGDPTNAILSNLRWLCPNCHAQTETYGKRSR